MEDVTGLPSDVWRIILVHTEPQDRLALRATCRYFVGVYRKWEDYNLIGSTIYYTIPTEILQREGTALKHLRSLRVTNATDEVISTLTHLRALQITASLSWDIRDVKCPLGDEGITGLTQLEVLSVEVGTAITGRALSRLTNLRSLSVPYAHDRYIQHLTNLVVLRLDHPQLNDSVLLGLPHLRFLSITGSAPYLTDAGLSQLTWLDTLCLAANKLTGAGLTHLKRVFGMGSMCLLARESEATTITWSRHHR